MGAVELLKGRGGGRQGAEAELRVSTPFSVSLLGLCYMVELALLELQSTAEFCLKIGKNGCQRGPAIWIT